MCHGTKATETEVKEMSEEKQQDQTQPLTELRRHHELATTAKVHTPENHYQRQVHEVDLFQFTFVFHKLQKTVPPSGSASWGGVWSATVSYRIFSD